MQLMVAVLLEPSEKCDKSVREARKTIIVYLMVRLLTPKKKISAIFGKVSLRNYNILYIVHSNCLKAHVQKAPPYYYFATRL